MRARYVRRVGLSRPRPLLVMGRGVGYGVRLRTGLELSRRGYRSPYIFHT